MPPGAGRFTFRLEYALIPLSLAAMGIAAFIFGATRNQLLAIALVLPLLPFAATIAGHRAWRSAEKAVTSRVLRRDIAGALVVIRRAWLARMLGPRHLFLSRYAMLHSLAGEWHRASALLDDAWVAAPAMRRSELLPQIARAKYESAQWQQLALLASDWRRVMPASPSARVYAAAAALFGPAADAATATELIRDLSGLSADQAAVLQRLNDVLRKANAASSWSDSTSK